MHLARLSILPSLVPSPFPVLPWPEGSLQQAKPFGFEITGEHAPPLILSEPGRLRSSQHLQQKEPQMLPRTRGSVLLLVSKPKRN